MLMVQQNAKLINYFFEGLSIFFEKFVFYLDQSFLNCNPNRVLAGD